MPNACHSVGNPALSNFAPGAELKTTKELTAIVASAQDWATAQTVGKPKSGNVAGLDRIADRAAQSGASERTQRMADKVVKTSHDLVPAMASACEDRLHG